MSVYIKGMEMPIGNEVIYIFSDGTTQKALLAMREILETGKAIPVPEHGRLIDADAALRDGWTISRTYSASPTEMIYEAKTIDCLPTIIPESRGSEDE